MVEITKISLYNLATKYFHILYTRTPTYNNIIHRRNTKHAKNDASAVYIPHIYIAYET